MTVPVVTEPWTKPLGDSPSGVFPHTCGWCNREIIGGGIAVLVTLADILGGKPLYEARHVNGGCETKRFLFDGPIRHCFVDGYTFTWHPGDDTIAVLRPDRTPTTITADALMARTMRAFVDRCESALQTDLQETS